MRLGTAAALVRWEWKGNRDRGFENSLKIIKIPQDPPPLLPKNKKKEKEESSGSYFHHDHHGQSGHNSPPPRVCGGLLHNCHVMAGWHRHGFHLKHCHSSMPLYFLFLFHIPMVVAKRIERSWWIRVSFASTSICSFFLR